MHNLDDRAVKERVIGAIVLGVFVVLVVPVFLDGQTDASAVISERVTLPGQSKLDGQQQTIVLDRDRSQPVPSSGTPVSSPPLARPDLETTSANAQTSEATTATAAKELPSTLVASGQSDTGKWAVQIGSFSNHEKAERLAADLGEQGFKAFLSPHQTGSGEQQRVRVGPQKNRASAEDIANQLTRAGYQGGRVVPNP